MTLYDTLRNMIGYIQLDLTKTSNLLLILENPNSTVQQKADAKAEMKQCAKNIRKMLNTIKVKANYTETLDENIFTDEELIQKRCMC